MATSRIARAALAGLLLGLVGVSLYGVWCHWQLRQAEMVLRDLASGKRQAATTQLLERADDLARLPHWLPEVGRYRGLLIEWSAVPLDSEQRVTRWQRAHRLVSEASNNSPADGFIAVDQLRLALKLGLEESMGQALLKIDQRAPNNVQIHHSALKLLYNPQWVLLGIAQSWRQRELGRVAASEPLAWGLLKDVRHDVRGLIVCSEAPSDSALAAQCQRAKLML